MRIQFLSHMAPFKTIKVATVIGALITPLIWMQFIAAEETGEPAAIPIQITADNSLTIKNKNRSATFVGNVVAEQQGTKMTSDQLTIIYKSNSDGSTNTANNIERLDAVGHVRIVFDNKLAVSDHAVYIIENRKIILEGPNSRVVSGDDEISGTKITINRNDGQMMLEGNKKKRVKAVLHSDQRGLN